MAVPFQGVDSSTPGILQSTTQPTSPPSPLDGDDLEDYIQQFVAGVAGMDGTLVRPRWQPEPSNIPDFDVTWCATGITHKRPIGQYAADPTPEMVSPWPVEAEALEQEHV
jgi:hypothetical protein